MRFYTGKVLAVIFMLLLGAAVAAAQNGKASDKDVKQAGDRAKSAARAFVEIMGNADRAVPRELLDRAEAVAVFPGVLKAAFIIGGRGGEGLISRRTKDGWSAPAFFKLGGGSVGFQIGADKTDYIMLFMNDGGLKGLLEDKFEFGADAGVAAGPIGREASATTNTTLDAGILSYSRSKGAFAGIALKGSRIAPNNEVNQALYQQNAKEILSSETSPPLPDSVKSFPNTLSRYSTRRAGESNGKSVVASRQRTSGTAGNQTNARVDTETNTIIIGSAPRTAETADNNNQTGEPVTNSQTTAGAETNAAVPETPLANNVYTLGRSSGSQPLRGLARDVRAELLDLPDYGVFDWLEFEVTPNNTVIMRGAVTRAAIKDAAETAVKSIEGVGGVRSDIEVLPASAGDEELRAAVYKAVYSGQLFRYSTGANQPIHVIIRDGRATLKGTVEIDADRSFAAVKANSVNGVLAVSNELTVNAGERR